VGLGIQGSYSKMAAAKNITDMVEKPPPSPQKMLLKNLKTSKNFKKTPSRL
jgi:hypothetical protein